MSTYTHPFPGNKTYHLNHFTPDSQNPELPPETRTDADLDTANLLSSEMVRPEGFLPHPVGAVFDGLEDLFQDGPRDFHRPVLDIDFPAKLVPSSTPGRFHLYLDKPMTWAVYAKLLSALADAGVIERGYADACEARGASFVRLPWVKKDDV